MRKIAICDDNKAIRDFIERICYQFYDQCKVLTFSSGEALIAHKEHFDIIFMDIELENINGIETALEIRKVDIDVLIIVISGYEQYKLHAYQIHAFDFLDKPIKSNHLLHILKEAETYCSRRREKSYVSLKTIEGTTVFDIEDIIYFTYESRKIKIVSQKGNYYLYDNMGELSKKMRAYGFSNPHRAYLINLKHVMSISSTKVKLSNFVEIPISRNKAKEFKESYTYFLGEYL